MRDSHDLDQALRISGAVVAVHWSLPVLCTRGTDIWSLLVAAQLLTGSFNKPSIYTSTKNIDKYDYPWKAATGKENNILLSWGLFLNSK